MQEHFLCVYSELDVPHFFSAYRYMAQLCLLQKMIGLCITADIFSFLCSEFPQILLQVVRLDYKQYFIASDYGIGTV